MDHEQHLPVATCLTLSLQVKVELEVSGLLSRAIEFAPLGRLVSLSCFIDQQDCEWDLPMGAVLR